MIKKIIFFLVMSITLFSQENFPSLSKDDFSNFTLLREKQFDGNSLWGHINGGADLYLEYGFDKLLFQDIEFEGVKFRCEFYRMIDIESAFGIYSIKRFRCNKTDTLTKFICITENQIQSAVGSFYISISNETETPEALSLSFILFSKILQNYIGELFEIPEIISKNIPHSEGNPKLVKGELGLQNGFPMWESLFVDLEGYRVYIFTNETEDGYNNTAYIQFAKSDDVSKFCDNAGFSPQGDEEIRTIRIDGENKTIRKISTREYIYSESYNGMNQTGDSE